MQTEFKNRRRGSTAGSQNESHLQGGTNLISQPQCLKLPCCYCCPSAHLPPNLPFSPVFMRAQDYNSAVPPLRGLTGLWPRPFHPAYQLSSPVELSRLSVPSVAPPYPATTAPPILHVNTQRLIQAVPTSLPITRSVHEHYSEVRCTRNKHVINVDKYYYEVVTESLNSDIII